MVKYFFYCSHVSTCFESSTSQALFNKKTNLVCLRGKFHSDVRIPIFLKCVVIKFLSLISREHRIFYIIVLRISNDTVLVLKILDGSDQLDLLLLQVPVYIFHPITLVFHITFNRMINKFLCILLYYFNLFASCLNSIL